MACNTLHILTPVHLSLCFRDLENLRLQYLKGCGVVIWISKFRQWRRWVAENTSAGWRCNLEICIYLICSCDWSQELLSLIAFWPVSPSRGRSSAFQENVHDQGFLSFKSWENCDFLKFGSCHLTLKKKIPLTAK